MSGPEEFKELRMVPRPTPDELGRRFERERRALASQREAALDGSLAPYRVGSVPYLSGVPLTRGLEDQVTLLPPAQLAERLRENRLDAALVSVTEVLFQDRYDVLDGIGVCSLGEALSVLVAHRRPLSEATEIFCDPASLTGVQLLRVLLAERGWHPELKALPSYEVDSLPDYALLIGDRALDFVRGQRGHEVWDLGFAWHELTQLPFVYAVWALRRDIDQAPLCRRLREARDFGLDTLDTIIAERTEYDVDFRRDYLGWHIHYHVGSDEKRGLARFMQLLEKHGAGPVHAPRFVN